MSARVDKREEALREAATMGDLDTVRKLVVAGADVNGRHAMNGWCVSQCCRIN